MFLSIDAQDPCTAYLTLTDVTMTTDYVQGPQNPLRYGDFIDNFKWYRYTGSSQGVLTSTAPNGTQCLSLNQVWSSGKYEMHLRSKNGGICLEFAKCNMFCTNVYP